MQEIKFIADIMLGKLAKWLKILGFDCVYFNNIDRFNLLRIALSEARIILTRNTKLKNKKHYNIIFIKTNKWEEQIKEVLREYPMNSNLIFSRCVICNEKTESTEKEKVKNFIPPYVFETSRNFSYCKNCRKYFWDGTHINKVREIISKL